MSEDVATILFDEEDRMGLVEQVLAQLEEQGLDPRKLLFRVVDGRYIDSVLEHGTDRYGFDTKIDWEEQGYFGEPRTYEDVLFMSPKEDLVQAAEPEGCTACTPFSVLEKVENPHMTVYDASAFDDVHYVQYAFKNPDAKKDALVAVFKLADEFDYAISE